MKLPCVLVIMCVIAGCAQVSGERKPTATPSQPQAAAPASASSQLRATAPAPTPAAALTPAPSAPTATGGGPGGELGMVSGTVTKIDKGMGLLELQTPGGWSQFILTEPERKKELERVTVGERVDVKVEFRGSERKVVTVVRRNLPGTIGAETK